MCIQIGWLIGAEKIIQISPTILISNRLVITEDLVIILPVHLNTTLTIYYTLLYVFGQTGLSKQCRP